MIKIKKRLKIIILVIVLIIIAICIHFFFKNMNNSLLTNKSIEKNYFVLEETHKTIEEIMESDIIVRIIEENRNPDITLDSFYDSDGNEVIYLRTIYQIVLTSDGVLCEYSRSSYRTDIKYDGYEILKQVKLSSDQMEKFIKDIDSLKTNKKYYLDTFSYCIMEKNKDNKYVYGDDLDKKLSKYGKFGFNNK